MGDTDDANCDKWQSSSSLFSGAALVLENGQLERRSVKCDQELSLLCVLVNT